MNNALPPHMCDTVTMKDRTLSKWRIGLINDESKRQLLSGTFCTHQIQFYLHFELPHWAVVWYLRNIQSVSLSVLTIELSQILVSPFEFYSKSPSLISLPHVISYCRTTGSLVFFFLCTWLFHPCWNSWTGAPSFSQRMKLYVNVGIVNTLVLSFFRAFLCIWKACNI